ncbi:hypothetical protein EUGRSUZ_H03670 [Eucalyptus grandis]|uniref:Uncharacterized protein n=2 Tax=Eucalyptus grandis TaxID=71139 RepID=A0ACC3JU03_EUCGR|nr:hypothetical protein EUGRSUZ_H03670 [Eucalyptus grandis]
MTPLLHPHPSTRAHLPGRTPTSQSSCGQGCSIDRPDLDHHNHSHENPKPHQYYNCKTPHHHHHRRCCWRRWQRLRIAQNPLLSLRSPPLEGRKTYLPNA